MPRNYTYVGNRDRYSLGAGVGFSVDSDSLYKVDRILNGLKDLLSEEEVNRAFDEAERIVAPMATEFLAQNYAASGIKTQTGKLLDAIKRSTITIAGKGRNLWLHARMAANVNKYDEPRQKNTHFYNAAGALQYGGVYGSGGGRRHKLTLKKGAVGRFADPSDRYILASGKSSALSFLHRGKSVSVFGRENQSVRVTKPFNYYKFTTQQMAEILNVALGHFLGSLKKKLQSRSAA